MCRYSIVGLLVWCSKGDGRLRSGRDSVSLHVSRMVSSGTDIRGGGLIFFFSSPTLVANIWDVTDKDIDKFSQSVFDKLRMTANDVGGWRANVTKRDGTSLVAAVAQSRDTCKLKYLTGAAPVVYGIPFYL